ncbi:hypothetical protein [Schlesneria paludicola]|uniref:hypothetical protein n=1 Tax=Schlesneria paludicola TaxID=360056 RepID=UPI00029AF8AF|nr:hypothetical protein [Schlesneria paludicola]
MSKESWKFWGVVLIAWGFYSCWHMGYQSGYADGHATAWGMYEQPYLKQNLANSETFYEPDESFESAAVQTSHP